MKPQDVYICLWLCLEGRAQTYLEMGKSLGMSASETHAAVRRLGEARLIDPETRAVQHRVFCNFLIHGVPHAFPGQMKEVVLGIPTAWAAPVLKSISVDGQSLPPVWPDTQGTVQGVAVTPLYSSIPKAALKNQDLYDLLALVDALRIGGGGDRRKAAEEIFKRMTAFASV